MWTADIDVGGTLTDGVFTDSGHVVSVKVDTTPHDLTVCLFDCLAQGANALGFAGTAEFLEQIQIIRWSTTLTSNVLAELRGPRIGLLVSEGHERDLYGNEPRSIALGRILSESDVIGLNGAAGEPEIMNAARHLLESGVRRICISLKDSHRHPERESSIKRTIDRQYPDHFLGSVPVLAGSDISKSPDDRTRTHCALLNAYTHGALAATLFKAEDELRETSHFAGAFLVSHINGGVAGVAKTRSIDTIESGPILGIHASRYLAKVYGLKDLIAMDIGGTTAKISLLEDGEPVNRKPSSFFGIPVDISLPDLHSIALGGGSIIKPAVVPPAGSEQKPAVQLGPESMGSFPGPACYGLGGDQPTLTDALVTAGLIDPDYFLGGAKPLDYETARQTVEEMVARPLRISTEAACRVIINRAFESVAELIAETNHKLELSEYTLFAYGGNGGLFACGVAEKTGIDHVRLFSLGPVFSAFGSSVSDISHTYERSLPGMAISDGELMCVREMIDEMKSEAVKDMLGEGVHPDHVAYAIELEVSGNGRSFTPVSWPEPSLPSATELKAALISTAVAAGETSIGLEMVRLRATKAMPKPRFAERSLQGSDSSHALTGTRQVFWGSHNGEAMIYRWESLQPGNRVDGCAVLESMNTTFFVPEGWVMVVDHFGNGVLSRRKT